MHLCHKCIDEEVFKRSATLVSALCSLRIFKYLTVRNGKNKLQCTDLSILCHCFLY